MSPLKAHYFCSLLIGLREQTDKKWWEDSKAETKECNCRSSFNLFLLMVFSNFVEQTVIWE